MSPPLHRAFGDRAELPAYEYAPHGVGVRSDLVRAILDTWSGVEPCGTDILLRDAADNLYGRSIHEVARIAAAAVAARLETHP